VSPKPTLIVDESSARQVLLLKAFEAEDSAAWTVDDRAWASRLARDAGSAGHPPEHFVVERARHASQRLRARDAGLARWLDARPALWRWVLAAVLLGLVGGVAVDRIGPAQHINLLAPPVWLLVAWNLAVYVGIALQALMPRRAAARAPAGGRGLRRWLPPLWNPGLPRGPAAQRLALDWVPLALPLNTARAALLLHLAAATLALGLAGGMYLRGLVLDYRAGWQSTFLEAPTVHQVLTRLLAPASQVTGIALPGVEELAALRITPPAVAQGPAAGWIHLFAATLGLFVIGPRLLLAALAAWRVRSLRARWSLPWQDPYFQRLLAQGRGGPAQVWVLPHASALSAQAALGLQKLLAQDADLGLHLQLADPVPYGDEDQPEHCRPPPGTTLVVLLVDLTVTPEAEVHGRLLDTLRANTAALPLLLVADESAFVRRFGADSARRAERQGAWQRFAQSQGLRLRCATLAG